MSPLGPAGAALSLSSIEGEGAESSSSLILRAWRAADGALLWDRALECEGGGGGASSASADAGSSSDGTVAVIACGDATKGNATAFDGASGLKKWSVALPPVSDGGGGGDAPSSFAVGPPAPGASPSAVSVAWASASELGVVSLSGEDGREVPGSGSNKVHSAVRPLSPPSVVLASPGAAAALSLDGKRVCSVGTVGGVHCVSLPAEAGDCSPGGAGRLSAGGGAFVVASCSAGAAVVSLGSDSSSSSPSSSKPPSVLEFLKGATAGAADGSSYAGVSESSSSSSSSSEAGAVEVSSPLFPACSSPSSPPSTSPPSPSPLTPVRVWLGRVSSSSSSPAAPAPAVLVAARDGTLSLTVAGGKEGASRPKPLWVRHEALARSAAAVPPLFAPLPPAASSAASEETSSSSKMPFSSLLRLEWLAAKSHIPRGSAAAGLSPAEAAELRALRAQQARRGAASADARGFRQAALLLADSGTLYALHTGDGAMLWRADGVADAFESGGEAGRGGEGKRRRRRAVVHWRSSHSTSSSPPSSSSSSSSTAPLVAVFSGDSFSVIDAFSGSVLEKGKLPFVPVKVVELPGAGATRERPDAAFLLVGENSNSENDDDDDGRGPPVALFPPTESTLEAAEALESESPLRFWLQDAEAGTLTGFVVSKGGGNGGGDPELGRRLARSSSISWRHAFGGGPGGSLLAVAAPSARDAAPAAAAKVLGDRSMKLRLAPGSLLFVASANYGDGDENDENGGGENKNDDVSSSGGRGGGGITASILDAVSGQFVFRQSHATGAGPVLATWAENAVYYHFAESRVDGGGKNSPSSPASAANLSDLAADGTPAPAPPRWLLGSMELYDMARGKGLSAGALALGAAKGLLLKKARGARSEVPPSSTLSSSFLQSSFDPPPAEVLRATFSVPHPASTLSTTTSSRGVAARWLLLGDPVSGDLVAFDRRWLDPRRRPASDPSSAPAPSSSSPEALEGLPPYHPDLPVVQGMSPTHGARVPGLSGVAATPASLESTCLLLVAGGRRGGDLFGTRAQPASSFDALPPDFPFGLLLAATAATLAGAAALRVAADREALRQQWA